MSRLCAGLDEQVRIFRERPLEGSYPYLWLDAKVEKVREPGGVRSKALVVAQGVHETGHREIIGIDVGEAETEAFWREFLRGLRARGLAGVQLAVSDAHEGLKSAIAKVLGCPWQRCTVHFLRDMLGHSGKADQPLVSGAIRQIFAAESAAEARERLSAAVAALEKTTPKVARLLEAAEEDLLAFMSFPPEHWRKLRWGEPTGAHQPGDRAPLRRGRHLPERLRAHPPGRQPADRAERRVAGHAPLPLGGIDAVGARPGGERRAGRGGERAAGGLTRRPSRRGSYTTTRDLTALCSATPAALVSTVSGLA